MARAAAWEALAAGDDPAEVKRAKKRESRIRAENSLEAVALEWLHAQQRKWTPRYADHVGKRLRSDVSPALGKRPIAEIDAPELLDVRTMWKIAGRLRSLSVCARPAARSFAMRLPLAGPSAIRPK